MYASGNFIRDSFSNKHVMSQAGGIENLKIEALNGSKKVLKGTNLLSCGL